MVVGRRKHHLRVTVDGEFGVAALRFSPLVELAIRVPDDDIVVDEKVGVVEVLVLAANLDESAVRKLGARLRIAIVGPDRVAPVSRTLLPAAYAFASLVVL